MKVRNYRLYFTGQVVSVSGTWMQMVAQSYLILFPLAWHRRRRGHRHRPAVPAHAAARARLADWWPIGWTSARFSYCTQTVAGVLALLLGVLSCRIRCSYGRCSPSPTLLGGVNLFDNPARQTFVSEMVGLDLLPNAVSLNSVLMNSARVIGPAIGGVLILTLGVGTCFLVNAASYVAVIIALSLMRATELYQSRASDGPRGRSVKACATSGPRATCGRRSSQWRSSASSPSTSP